MPPPPHRSGPLRDEDRHSRPASALLSCVGFHHGFDMFEQVTNDTIESKGCTLTSKPLHTLTAPFTMSVQSKGCFPLLCFSARIDAPLPYPSSSSAFPRVSKSDVQSMCGANQSPPTHGHWEATMGTSILECSLDPEDATTRTSQTPQIRLDRTFSEWQHRHTYSSP